MRLRWLLPLVMVTSGASLAASVHAADALAVIAAKRLSALSTFVTPAPSTPPALELDEPPAIFAATPVTTAPAKKSKPKHSAAPRSVFVSAARVLAVAQSGARPRGKPVPKTATRPAGLKLSGVSALGLGVLDGDVLTEAAGAPALDGGAVIEAVLRARAKQAKTISGTFYRGDERYSLVVEQPYPVRRAEAPAPALTFAVGGRRLSGP